MKVEDVMAKDFPLVDKNETLYHAYKVMGRYGVDKMVVYEHHVGQGVGEKKRIAGVVTSRDIVAKLATERTRLTTPSSLHVSSFMSSPVATVSPLDSVDDVLRIMVEKGFGIIPVASDGGGVIGVVYREHCLRLVGDDDTEARVIMDPHPYTAKVYDRVLKVRDVMLKNDVSFMPVVDDNNDLVGYITISDVAHAIFKFQDIVPARYRRERIMHLTVEDIMRFRPPTLRITDTVATAAAKILEKNSKGVIVVDEIGDIAGVVTAHRIIKHVLDKAHRREQGSL